jgi:hypothetical protein
MAPLSNEAGRDALRSSSGQGARYRTGIDAIKPSTSSRKDSTMALSSLSVERIALVVSLAIVKDVHATAVTDEPCPSGYGISQDTGRCIATTTMADDGILSDNVFGLIVIMLALTLFVASSVWFWRTMTRDPEAVLVNEAPAAAAPSEGMAVVVHINEHGETVTEPSVVVMRCPHGCRPPTYVAAAEGDGDGDLGGAPLGPGEAETKAGA